jgi:peroxisomal enoyl-CoA hydratase 2
MHWPTNLSSSAVNLIYTNIEKLAYKGIEQDVIDFTTQGKPSDITGIPGVPKFDRNKIVDGQKHITIHRQLPTSSQGKSFQLHQSLLGLYDKGKAGTVIETETVLLDKITRDVYATITGSVFAVGQGDWGGAKGMYLDLYK